ncbi:MAG: DUF1080 domain-containing protein [Lentisphaeraceae bacterium]|nr:DUF1080 domain-containing protein [Lentisphaeraceae bacterium]
MKTFLVVLFYSLLSLPLLAQQNGIWTDPAKAAEEIDYQVQGEYAGVGLGAQVIALGDGKFCAVIYEGGLPGAGWVHGNKIVLHGALEGKKASFKAPTGKLSYVNKDPEKFSPVKQFPPKSQKAYSGLIDGDSFNVKTHLGEYKSLKKVNRQSPTLGKKAPEGAMVLFDGSSTDAFIGGRLDEATKFLNTDGKDIKTKEKFSNYKIHIEFMLPYKPKARGQGRGNSGFYQIDHYEVQVLDSFGLNGENNECGGVYTKAKPLVNMCFPPLSWQTYDVDFTNAVTDADGKVVKHAKMTVMHNGIVIHDNLEIVGKTGGSRGEAIGTPGPMKFQGHGNPVQYRNMWILKK